MGISAITCLLASGGRRMTVETQYGNHLGGGVVLYEGAFELDWDWMRNFCHETTLKEREGMYTPGGFTDGDRAICLLLAIGVQIERLILVGYDPDLIGRWSGVFDENVKRRKLGWMAKILDRLGFGNGDDW